MMLDKGFYVYIITNQRNGTLYIGHTDNLGQRIEQHKRGVFEGFSKRYGLKHLVWFEVFETRGSAFKKERQLKAWKRKWKLELIETLNPYWIDIVAAPVWPLPDEKLFPELFSKAMEFRLDPKSSLG